MKSTVNVRGYQSGDLEACRGLWRELVQKHREIYSDQSIGGDKPELFFDKHLAKVGAEGIWVAIVDGKVVGFAGLQVEEKEGTMEPLVVGEAWRGQGIGKLLVDKVVREAHRQELRFLNVEPVARNAEAIQFFREMGFKMLGRVQLSLDLSGKKWKSSITLQEMKFDY